MKVDCKNPVLKQLTKWWPRTFQCYTPTPPPPPPPPPWPGPYSVDLGPAGIKPAVAVDKAGYAHVVYAMGEGSPYWKFVDQNVHGWTTTEFNVNAYHQSPYGLSGPAISYDADTDKLWYSGIMAGEGMAIICRDVQTLKLAFARRTFGLPQGPITWAAGNISGNGMCFINGGFWEQYDLLDGNISTIARGSNYLSATNYGERVVPNYRYANGMGHIAYLGHPELLNKTIRYCGYIKRDSPVVPWLDSKILPAHAVDNESNYIGICIGKDGEAYLAVDGKDGAIRFNIVRNGVALWDFKTPRLLNGSTGADIRYGVQMCPCPTGGCYMALVNQGEVVTCHIAADGGLEDAQTWGQGFTPTVAVDAKGNQHVVYSNAGRMWGIRK